MSEAVNHDYPPDVDIDHTLFMFESRRVNGNRGLQNIRNTRKSTPLGAGPQHTSKKQPKVPRLFSIFLNRPNSESCLVGTESCISKVMTRPVYATSSSAGNNGCAARIFSALPVSTVISARRVRRSPGSPQAVDACGAELALAGVSSRAAERAEGFGKRRCGSPGVAVCGPCLPAVRLNSNSSCGDRAARHLGRQSGD